MASTGLRYPSSVSNVTQPGGSVNWINGSRAVDGDDATAATCYVIDYDNTSLFRCVNLGAHVPLGTFVTGVEVEVYAKGDGTSFNVFEGPFKLVVGGAVVGVAQNGPGHIASTPTRITRGSSSNLWGLSSLSVSEVNAADFGVVIAYNCNDAYAGSNLSIYSVRMNLYYEPLTATLRREIIQYS